MASASLDIDKIEDDRDNSLSELFTRIEISPRQNSAAANVYTPLLAPERSKGQSLSNVSPRDSFINIKDISKTLPDALNKQVDKPTLQLQAPNSKGQRSSVRPFFCCGSELSLVSLVDGLEGKESSSSSKIHSNIESTSLSDEEVGHCSKGLPRKSSSCHTTLYNSDSRHAFVRRKIKDKHGSKKKSWGLRFRGRWNPRWRVSQPQHSVNHRFDHSHHCAPGTYQRSGSPGVSQRSQRLKSVSSTNQFIDLSQIQDFDRLYPVNDVETILIRERVEEMRTGVEVDSLSFTRPYQTSQPVLNSMFDILRRRSQLGSVSSDITPPSPEIPPDYSVLLNSAVWRWQDSRSSSSIDGILSGSPRIHTQVDFIHCLVPDLVRILSCPFYWGVMDRYEAERLLDNKPEGTFLLRDSAQEDFLFSVSFRRYNRSLHARVEQWNHRFSFDAHDPAVFSAPSVCELMEHYKDPCCCMFFEPMLTRPLPRNFPFSLQHICRAAICDRIAYDQIRLLPLPNSLKQFLQIYHYKQKVRVRCFDDSVLS